MRTLSDSGAPAAVSALDAYEALAEFYDGLTADHDYAAWTASLEELAVAHGLADRTLLDIACGTGKSFVPFLERGFRVAACDLSPAMLARAAAKADGRARLFVADMRALPAIEPVALATCLDDSLNYLLDGDDLRSAFASAGRSLRPDGLYLFDVNTLGAYRTVFARDASSERDGCVFLWRGRTSPDLAAGGMARAVVEVVDAAGLRFSHHRSDHVQRHHPHALVSAALRDAGMRCLAVHGLTPDGVMHDVVDELAHTKRIYVAALATAPRSPNPRSRKEVSAHASHQEAREPRRAGGLDHQGQLGPPAARPRLKPSVEVLQAAGGDVYLLRGHEDLVIEAAPPECAPLLERLDGRRDVDELAAELQALGHAVDAAAVLETVTQLRDLGVVEDAGDPLLSAAEVERFEGQLRYFADLAQPGARRDQIHRRLADATIVVLGMGGLGSWAALALACCGVGRLRAVDGDVVELSNLNRQMLFRESDLGRPKVEAAAGLLRGFHSALVYEPVRERVESEGDVARLVEGADFVVDAADWPPGVIERWVNDACFAQGIPYSAMSQHPPLIRWGPTYVPGRTGCYACLTEDLRERHPLFDELAAMRRERRSGAATFGPACALLGGHAAMEAVHTITGLCEPATLGAALVVDLRTMQVTREEVPRRPGCPVCSPPAASLRLRENARSQRARDH